ncbi:MAG: TIGR04211 family SH3 domain-containing protein [Gammaproteobacteria bacterium]|nr:TIGR04211 family SH3 domain-containing protein [Gammaproteobacteria bacterium]MDH5799845.1 TIGR04211 family SH3 domain-containing protein [Gammaproteobacteria bacterium]
MTKLIFSSLFISLFIISPATATAAEGGSKYVSDEIIILLRAGPSNKHKILKNLKSGDKVEATGVEEGEYSQIRVGDQEGWALSRHLSAKPAAKFLLDRNQKKLESLEEKYSDLQQQLKDLETENQTLKETLASTTDEKTKMVEELSHLRDVAAKPLELSNVNKDLTMQAVSLENQVEMMKQEIQVLRNDSDKQWFLTGAGVILLGLLVGMVIPKFRRHRRSDWSSL